MNILLDESANLKHIDFDCAVEYGRELISGTTPFCKVNEELYLPLAGVETETFAIGSCIYNMHFGHPPWSKSLEEEMN